MRALADLHRHLDGSLRESTSEIRIAIEELGAQRIGRGTTLLADATLCALVAFRGNGWRDRLMECSNCEARLRACRLSR